MAEGGKRKPKGEEHERTETSSGHKERVKKDEAKDSEMRGKKSEESKKDSKDHKKVEQAKRATGKDHGPKKPAAAAKSSNSNRPSEAKPCAKSSMEGAKDSGRTFAKGPKDQKPSKKESVPTEKKE